MPGVVECLKIVTREESYRIAKLAFDYATKHERKKVSTDMQTAECPNCAFSNYLVNLLLIQESMYVCFIEFGKT